VRKLLKFIAQHSIAAKLAAMAMASALFMLFVALTVLFIARNELANERTERAHAIVDAVWSMADSFKRAAETGAISEEEAKARFYAASGAVWFEGHTNYVFIYDTETGLCSTWQGAARARSGTRSLGAARKPRWTRLRMSAVLRRGI
jgi:methyl-accepting chemotaxis protein